MGCLQCRGQPKPVELESSGSPAWGSCFQINLYSLSGSPLIAALRDWHLVGRQSEASHVAPKDQVDSLQINGNFCSSRPTHRADRYGLSSVLQSDASPQTDPRKRLANTPPRFFQLAAWCPPVFGRHHFKPPRGGSPVPGQRHSYPKSFKAQVVDSRSTLVVFHTQIALRRALAPQPLVVCRA